MQLLRENAGMIRQRTLKSLTRAVGVGMHSGQRVELTLRPAPPDTGIVFRRIDLPQPVEIPARFDSVCDTRMASTISLGGDPGAPKVQTIEHFMSACCGLGLDNLVVDITADEVPILDGSAASFVFLLQSAGIELQNAPKRFIRVIKPMELRQGEGARLMWARLEPFDGFKLTFEIDFDHPAVDATGQRTSFDMGSGLYKRDIARARTFGFSKDVEAMRSRGLTLGGGMDNAIVVGDHRVHSAGLEADGLYPCLGQKAHAARAGARGQRHGQAGGVDEAVGGQEDRAAHVVEGHQRKERLGLGRAD